MKKKKNRYHKKAKMKGILGGFTVHANSKGKIKSSVLETGKDLLVGVIGGGVAGAIIGKPSLLIGLLATGAGHYTNNRLIQLLGIGMMAANGFQTKTAVSGLNGLDGVKERLQAYKDSIKDKFYLDKILKAKAVGGFGDVQYFSYPENGNELAALDSIEDQLIESGMQFSGADAVEAEFGDVEELNL